MFLTWSGRLPSLSVKNTLCRCLRSFSKVLRLSSTEALVIMFLPWVANTADLTVAARNTAPGSPRHVHSTWMMTWVNMTKHWGTLTNFIMYFKFYFSQSSNNYFTPACSLIREIMTQRAKRIEDLPCP